MRRLMKILLVPGILLAGWAGWDQFAPINRAAWLGDLDTLAAHTAVAYANLDWQVSRGVDPVRVYHTADSALRAAHTRRQARAALQRFAGAFDDGHFRIGRPTPAWVTWLEGRVRGAGGTEVLSLDLDPARACAVLGVESRQRASVLASAPGWAELDDTPPFPTGRLALPDGRVAGVLRLPSFREDRYPEVCRVAWAAFTTARGAAGTCASECEWEFRLALADSLLAAQAARLRSLTAAGADLLVVDLTGNGGGTDWVDPAARQVTGRPLRSPRATGVRHPHHAAQLEQALAALDGDRARPEVTPPQRALLDSARTLVTAALADASAPCDRRGIWRAPLVPACRGLIEPSGFTSGVLAEPPGVPLDGLSSHDVLFRPSSYRWSAGAWDGPVIVLVDGHTASAAEEFAARLQDAGAAVVAGVQTAGAGCGYTDGGIPLQLPHSGFIVRMPDCARLRADGMNEVAGVTPDLRIPWGTDSARGDALLRALGGAPGHRP